MGAWWGPHVKSAMQILHWRNNFVSCQMYQSEIAQNDHFLIGLVFEKGYSSWFGLNSLFTFFFIEIFFNIYLSDDSDSNTFLM